MTSLIQRTWGICLLTGLVAMSPNARAQVPDSILDEEPIMSSATPIPDRIEGVNRFFFKFNDGFYRFALRPISRGYATVVPRPVRRGIGNFFNNLRFPTRFVGNVLEGQPKAALKETGRFLVNTTAGLGGFVQVADEIPELRVPPSDLGQAFARWGIGHGTYLVLPLMGATSLRDGAGEGISGVYLSPQRYLPEWEYSAAAQTLNVVNESPELMDMYFNFKEGAIDPYIALRDAFASRRAAMVRERPSNAARVPAPENERSPAAATAP